MKYKSQYNRDYAAYSLDVTNNCAQIESRIRAESFNTLKLFLFASFTQFIDINNDIRLFVMKSSDVISFAVPIQFMIKVKYFIKLVRTFI